MALQLTLEDWARWSEVVTALEVEPLTDVARRFQVSPGQIASALRRTGQARTAITTPGLRVPTPASAEDAPSGVVEPPPTVQPARAPEHLSKMDEHLARYRAAVGTGSGKAYLAGLHRLVRARLRARLATLPGDAALLARFDEDVALPAPAPDTSPRPERRPSRREVAKKTTSEVAPPKESSSPAQRLAETTAPGRRTAFGYQVVVLASGERRNYVVVSTTLEDAVARAAASGVGEVVSVVRGLEVIS